MLSVHHDVDSPVHAMPAWSKLLVLFAAGIGAFFVHSPVVLGAAVLCLLGLYALARIPWRLALRQVTVALPFVVVVFLAQWWLAGVEHGVLIALRLVLLLLLAGLVSLTTRAEAMIAVVEAALWPLRAFGVRPERVGMVIMMTIRFVPVLKEQADAVRAAQKARGVERSTVFLTPLLVKTLRMADSLAQALDARGVDAPRRTTGDKGA